MKEHMIEVIKYCAFDGKEFDTPEECTTHEYDLTYQQMVAEGRAPKRVDEGAFVGYNNGSYFGRDCSIFNVKDYYEIQAICNEINKCYCFEVINGIDYEDIVYPTTILWNEDGVILNLQNVIDNLTRLQNEGKI